MDFDSSPEINQAAGHDQAVAAVVPLPNDNYDLLVGDIGKSRAELFGDGASGHLHEHQAGDAKALYRLAIELGHLRSGEDFHKGSSTSGRNGFKKRTPSIRRP
jgi:hypothetical protein